MSGKFFNIYNEIGRLRDMIIEKDLSYSQTNDILNQILLIETHIDMLERETENKGEWIAYHLGAKWICSKCNEKNDSRDNFCPNCGADMRGGKKCVTSAKR